MVQDLERSRDKEARRSIQATRELQKLRSQLQSKDREIRSLRVRPSSAGHSVHGGSIASGDSHDLMNGHYQYGNNSGSRSKSNSTSISNDYVHTVIPVLQSPKGKEGWTSSESPTWRTSPSPTAMPAGMVKPTRVRATRARAGPREATPSPRYRDGAQESEKEASMRPMSAASASLASLSSPIAFPNSVNNGHGFTKMGNTSASHQAQALREAETECDRLRATVACQEEDLHRAASEIEVLACALEQRAEDLGVDGNLHSGLLYQVGMLQKEVHRLEMELATREGAERELKREIVESQRHHRHVQERLENAEKRINDLLEERQVVLDYLKENKSKTGRLEEEVKQLSHERDRLQHEARNAVSGEQSANFELEGMRTQLLRARTQQHGPGSPDVSPVGDPAFETLLRETEAEIHAGAMAAERSKLLEDLRHQRDKIYHLEHRLQSQTSRSDSLESRVPELEQEIAALRAEVQQQDQYQKEVLKSPIRHHHANLLSDDSTPENLSNLTGSSARPLSASSSSNHLISGRSGRTDSKDLHSRQNRLEGLLKVANEAREMSEKEAVRLEAENARLRRELRIFQQQPRSSLSPPPPPPTSESSDEED